MEGITVGLREGAMVGIADGIGEGLSLGALDLVGALVGSSEGTAVIPAILEEATEGTNEVDGVDEPENWEGLVDSNGLGRIEGIRDGDNDDITGN